MRFRKIISAILLVSCALLFSSCGKTDGNEQYKTLLMDMLVNPDNYVDNANMDFADNYFAIGDIDCDGENELIVNFESTFTGAQYMGVWKYDEASNKTERLYKLIRDSEFYETGYVRSPASRGADNWPIMPFIVSRLEDGEDKEVCVISSEWINEVEFDLEGNYNSEDVRYYFSDDGENRSVISQEEYREIVNTYIPEDKFIDLDFISFTEENVNAVK